MAGTGKTYMLREIADIAMSMGIVVYSTATTGVAAINLRMGTTFHSYAGIGTAWQDKENLFRFARTNKKARERIQNTQILIIDEISMYGTDLLAKVDYVFKNIRCNNEHFGGIQLVLSGDFLQLPPVKDEWIFKAPEWKQLNLVPYVLTECRRYSQEQFFEMLSRLRKGTPSPQDIILLKERAKAYRKFVPKPGGILPTIFYSRKVDAETYNTEQLSLINSPEHTFVAIDTFNDTIGYAEDRKPYIEMLDNSIPREITLKVGAQVMLRWNLDTSAGLCNGSRGVVVRIGKWNGEEAVTVKFVNGAEENIIRNKWTSDSYKASASRVQIPLILAFAMTIHKSQGQTLDYAVVNVGHSIFANGQAYVALSRVRDIEGLFISEFIPNTIRADGDALDYVERIEAMEHEHKRVELVFE